MITSVHNEKIKFLLKLRMNKHRKGSNLFIIEGFRELLRAIEKNITIKEIFFSETFVKNKEISENIKNLKKKYSTEEVSENLFEKISYRENPDGILAVANVIETRLDELKLSKNPIILAVERIEKPGNLGALIRTAEASGMQAIVLIDSMCDPFNPNSIRASQGSLFSIPVISCLREEFLSFAKKYNLKLIITTPVATKKFWEVDMRGPIAILAGNEHDGLSKFWFDSKNVINLEKNVINLEKNVINLEKEGINHGKNIINLEKEGNFILDENIFVEQVCIPMIGMADSLNVNMATGIVLFESVRQRYEF